MRIVHDPEKGVKVVELDPTKVHLFIIDPEKVDAGYIENLRFQDGAIWPLSGGVTIIEADTFDSAKLVLEDI